MHKHNLKVIETEPPQGLHIPELPPIVLDEKDAVAFYQKLEDVRSALPDDKKHYLKKDRELADLKIPQAKLIGIKDGDDLIAGGMVIMPVTRAIAMKYFDYPWDAKAESTALLSALWTDPDHLRRGFSLAVIGKIIEVAKEAGMTNVLTGMAEGNPVVGAFEKAANFRHVHSWPREEKDGKPTYIMNYMRHIL